MTLVSGGGVCVQMDIAGGVTNFERTIHKFEINCLTSSGCVS